MLGPLASFVEEGLREAVSRRLVPGALVSETSGGFQRGRLHWTRLWSIVVLATSRSDRSCFAFRMKILRSIHSVNPALGGPIESVKQSSAILARRGHDVEIISLDAPADPWVRACPIPVHALGPGRSSYGYAPRFLAGSRSGTLSMTPSLFKESGNTAVSVSGALYAEPPRPISFFLTECSTMV